MMKTEDIIGVAAFFLPFLGKKNKKASSGTGLERFKDYPNSGGEYGTGYYDKVTQETISEQQKKDAPTYVGDKGNNSQYDPFYNLTQSQSDAISKMSAQDADNYLLFNLATRVRIVPNSFFCSAKTEKISDGSLRELHTYACVVEIFNPFPDLGGKSNALLLDHLEYATITDDKYNSSTKKYDIDCGIRIKGATGSYFPSYYDTATSKQYHIQLTDRLLDSPMKFLESHATLAWSAAYQGEGMKKTIAPKQSVYIPVLLSFMADPKGNFDPVIYPTPLYMTDAVKFFQYGTNNKTVTGENVMPVRGIEFSLNVGVRTGRIHKVRISMDKDDYSFTAAESFSNSKQIAEYFRPNATPIFQRSEFWSSIFGQKNINSLETPSPQKVRSYFAAAPSFLAMEKFAPFGSIII